MRYLCLIYFDEALIDTMSDEDVRRLRADSSSGDERLKEAGYLVLASPLQRTDTAITVRVRDGKMSATDGPFMETKEALGGFILIEARDLNEAVRIAGKVPWAKYGSVEVRPIGPPARRSA